MNTFNSTDGGTDCSTINPKPTKGTKSYLEAVCPHGSVGGVSDG